MKPSEQIQVQNLDHLGLVAGIIDEIGLVEQINQLVGQHECERVSPGHVVKAIILNGLGFVSAPLYLFSRFFEGKATEHLIGEGVQPEHLNDDRMGASNGPPLPNGTLTTVHGGGIKRCSKVGRSNE